MHLITGPPNATTLNSLPRPERDTKETLLQRNNRDPPPQTGKSAITTIIILESGPLAFP